MPEYILEAIYAGVGIFLMLYVFILITILIPSSWSLWKSYRDASPEIPFVSYQTISKQTETSESKKIKIFLSYSRQDILIASTIYQFLTEKENVYVWFDIIELGPSENWMAEIKAGLDNCDFLIFLASEFSLRSPYVMDEWHYTLTVEKPVYVWIITNCEIHPLLKDVTKFDLRNEPFNEEKWEEAYQQAISQQTTVSGYNNIELDKYVFPDFLLNFMRKRRRNIYFLILWLLPIVTIETIFIPISKEFLAKIVGIMVLALIWYFNKNLERQLKTRLIGRDKIIALIQNLVYLKLAANFFVFYLLVKAPPMDVELSEDGVFLACICGLILPIAIPLVIHVSDIGPVGTLKTGIYNLRNLRYYKANKMGLGDERVAAIIIEELELLIYLPEKTIDPLPPLPLEHKSVFLTYNIETNKTSWEKLDRVIFFYAPEDLNFVKYTISALQSNFMFNSNIKFLEKSLDTIPEFLYAIKTLYIIIVSPYSESKINAIYNRLMLVGDNIAFIHLETTNRIKTDLLKLQWIEARQSHRGAVIDIAAIIKGTPISRGDLPLKGRIVPPEIYKLLNLLWENQGWLITINVIVMILTILNIPYTPHYYFTALSMLISSGIIYYLFWRKFLERFLPVGGIYILYVIGYFLSLAGWHILHFNYVALSLMTLLHGGFLLPFFFMQLQDIMLSLLSGKDFMNLSNSINIDILKTWSVSRAFYRNVIYILIIIIVLVTLNIIIPILLFEGAGDMSFEQLTRE